MRFYVDALDVHLFTPIYFKHYDVKVSALISVCDINKLLEKNGCIDKIVKPFEKFKNHDLTVPQEWIRYVASQESFTVSSVKNAGTVRNDLIEQYNLEMSKKKVKDFYYAVRQTLCIKGRKSFCVGDLVYFTTTITYPTSISRIYLMECIII